MSEHESWFAPGGGAAQVSGWLSPISGRAISALLSYQQEQAIEGSLVEIGVYHGKTFIGLAQSARQNERAVAVDIFTYEGASTLETFTEELKRHLTRERQRRVVVARQDSTKLSMAQWLRMLERPARFAHVDGDHTREAVINDIQLVSAALADKGVVVIDDFLHPHYADVTEGIFDALRAARNLVPIALLPGTGDIWQGGHKLVCCTRESASEYQRLLRRAFAGAPVRQHPILGQPVIAFVQPKPA